MDDERRLRMLDCPKGPVDMVLDTDAYNEVDDQYAISYAVHASEKLCVKAFYAAPFFNKKSSGPADGMEKSRREIRHILALAGREEYPVLAGSREYLPDEKTPVDSEAMRDLCERAMQYSPERPLYVVAIGAITNIASALLAAPEIAERIVIVWLGGNALHWPDNLEFNCRQDVAAARVVMDSGAPLVLLPCKGVVSAFTTTGPELEYWLRGKNALCDYLVDHTEETANAYAKGRVWSRPLWDVTAIGWLLNEEDRFMLSSIVPTPIPEYSHHYSRDLRRPPCRMVYHIYRDALLADLIEHITK
ncbi:MAG: nucleoside hydrolase [Lachnospiraceae bacterium]|nr:nucleoside hydrolase [Lachnospiraceae bacterium]